MQGDAPLCPPCPWPPEPLLPCLAVRSRGKLAMRTSPRSRPAAPSFAGACTGEFVSDKAVGVRAVRAGECSAEGSAGEFVLECGLEALEEGLERLSLIVSVWLSRRGSEQPARTPPK